MLPTLLAAALLGLGAACSDSAEDTGACDDLADATGEAVIVSTTEGAPDAWGSMSCGGSAAPDVAWLWTAPTTDCYSMDTLAADFDTVLSVLDDTCGGWVAACSDDSHGEVQSRLTLDAVQGQTYTIVLDGATDGAMGAYVLRIETCDESDAGQIIDLGEATGVGVARGNNAGEDDTLNSDCGVWQTDVVYAWTAPADGTWTFDLAGSDFDTVLSVQLPDRGGELACNDDADIDHISSALSVDLLAGDAVWIGVAGYAGDTGVFVLSITEG